MHGNALSPYTTVSNGRQNQPESEVTHTPKKKVTYQIFDLRYSLVELKQQSIFQMIQNFRKDNLTSPISHDGFSQLFETLLLSNNF